MQMRFTHVAAALLMTAALFATGCHRPPTDSAQSTADPHAAAAPAAALAGAGASPAESSPSPAAVSGPGGWFVKTGCTKCHSISVYDVKSETNIGPDLSIAADDVKARFGMPLDEFLAAPSGTMAIVLSTQIQLSPEQKKIAIAKLKDAYAEYLRQQATGHAAGAATSSTR
jgi:hypothetical protein